MNIYTHLFANPLHLIPYILIIGAFITIWVYNHMWIWGGLTLLAYITAFTLEQINIKTLGPILILLLAHIALSTKQKYVTRFIPTIIVIIVSFGFIWHLFQGFNNLVIANDLKVSPNGINYLWQLTLDKPLIGLIPLGLYIPLLVGGRSFSSILLKTIPLSIIVAAILFSLAIFLDMIVYDPKIPIYSGVWLLTNLFFVVIPEEAFFRGFLQAEIENDLNSSFSTAIAIFSSSILFALAHTGFSESFTLLIVSFVASLFYGIIYRATRSIESAIITHLIVNIIHFFFFTYPVLNSAL